ncbi:MAG: acetyl-CoA carboxylase carboxyltransferase subunit beta [Deltaproteobacteria bacterium]|jgi:acetyl-CoA carboxylase carboxyl transferase subunit beta|nr:acetyl-CoA carboxylase carboxyltransferase subunit beta [Deltaproteobacteria bacterium]MBT4090518.1 acetyl-CoA carboxylase carboxyltransferase subunit beta [Deltaproteobacteria bacterium]MBT4262892.1 acetyl-CoA carboxylase carboxyltransferase subunit beta [Deltaproteobacteria bacterium]MBT4644195.1 acetyl-CoA carboxylase carboxyltransferase subunit beta [Deltaproteobacteria bacterium]MBT6502707.1 acetyl-CoA carboxylase carboxyltransferase subunit beta [Deltaproteobacteria bacterium]
MSIAEWLAKKAHIDIEPDKLDIPGDLQTKCLACGEVLFRKMLIENQKVCPHCNYHFRLTCSERLAFTTDADTFKEFNQNLESTNFLKFKDTQPYSQRIEQAQKRSGIKDAIITGIAEINGHKNVISIMDFGFMGGSMGSVVGEKFSLAVETAIKKKLPLISMSNSGGARMQEGIISLMQMAKTSAAIKQLADAGLFYISVLLDPTTGGTTASFAMLGDVHLSEPNALIGFAGKRVIEQTIRQKLPKYFQRAEFVQQHGMIDKIVHRHELKLTLGRLLEYAE